MTPQVVLMARGTLLASAWGGSVAPSISGSTRARRSLKPQKALVDESLVFTFKNEKGEAKVGIDVADANDLLLASAFAGDGNCLPLTNGGWPTIGADVDLTVKWTVLKTAIHRAPPPPGYTSADIHSVEVIASLSLFGDATPADRRAGRDQLVKWLDAMGWGHINPEDIRAVDLEEGRILVQLRNYSSDALEDLTIDIPAGATRGHFASAFIDYAEATNRPVLAARLRAQRRRVSMANLAEATIKPQTETAPVSTTPDKKLSDSAEDFGVNVAYRTAALQLTKRTRGLLADALTQHLKGKARASKRQVVLDLLDGPMGGPLVAVLLSGVLPQAAGLIGQNGAKMDRLAEELRLHAGVSVASDLVDGLFGLLGPAREVLTQALSGLPDVAPLQEGSRGGVVLDMERVGAAVR